MCETGSTESCPSEIRANAEFFLDRALPEYLKIAIDPERNYMLIRGFRDSERCRYNVYEAPEELLRMALKVVGAEWFDYPDVDESTEMKVRVCFLIETEDHRTWWHLPTTAVFEKVGKMNAPGGTA